MSHNTADPFDFLSLEVEPGVKYCFDDTYLVDPNAIENDPFLLTKLQRPVYVSHMTPTVRQYNQMSMSSQPLIVKETFDDEKVDAGHWHMPSSYLDMSPRDIVERLLDKQTELGLDDELLVQRNDRIIRELSQYKQADKLDLIRLMFYIVDQMTAHNKLWGVGRGSSVSSYVLFLIGVHDIDSVMYDLDFADFMKSQ